MCRSSPRDRTAHTGEGETTSHSPRYSRRSRHRLEVPTDQSTHLAFCSPVVISQWKVMAWVAGSRCAHRRGDGLRGPSLIGHCETKSTNKSAPRALTLTSLRSPVLRIRSTGRQLGHGPRSSASRARPTTVSDQPSRLSRECASATGTTAQAQEQSRALGRGVRFSRLEVGELPRRSHMWRS
jgi:hypothetical protein